MLGMMNNQSFVIFKKFPHIGCKYIPFVLKSFHTFFVLNFSFFLNKHFIKYILIFIINLHNNRPREKREGKNGRKSVKGKKGERANRSNILWPYSPQIILWPNSLQNLLHYPNSPKSMEFPMDFPTNLTWEIIMNCTCPFPDYNCWRPVIYAKPIECVPSSIDLNQLFNGINNNGNGGGSLLAVIGICLQILDFGFAIYSFMALSRSRRQELRRRSRRQELRNENVVEEGNNNTNVIRLPANPYPPLTITCALCRRGRQQQPMPTIEERVEEEEKTTADA